MAPRPDAGLENPFAASDPSLVEHQRARLYEVLRHAARAPGHRERLFRAGVCDSHGGLTREWLPAFACVEPIHRFEVRQNPGSFLADARDAAYRGSTSGTRSEVFVYFSGQEWNALRQERRDLALSWWGITQEVPIVNAVSRLMPARAQDFAIGGALDMDRILRSLDGFADAGFVLRGYPSRLSELATLWLSLPVGVRKPRPRAVLCTGEVLYAQQRHLLERAFGAPVVNEYGCHETGIAGFTCPEESRLHLDGLRCLFEVRGEELVTTDLYNCTLPAVRYLPGDLVALEPAPCPCGRPGPTARVLGRTEDRVLLRGERVPAGAVDLEPRPGVSAYTVARDEAGILNLHAVRAPDEPESVDLLQATAAWAEQAFGEPTRVSLYDVTAAEVPRKRAATPAGAWIRALLEEDWGQEELEPSLPEGALEEWAELHRDILAPCEISPQRGMAPGDCARLERLLGEELKGPAVEQLVAARLLVWASAHRPYPEARACQDLSVRALERLRRVLVQAHAAGVPVAAAATDLEIARWLLVPADATERLRSPVPAGTHRLDALNAHHLLAALEQAWLSTSRAEQALVCKRLRPLLPVLIADAQFFAADFGPWLLSVFQAMLRPGGAPERPSPPAHNAFAQGWWYFRLQLAAGEATSSALEALREACTDERQAARCRLEAAYLALVRDELGDPEPWLDLFHSAAEALSGDEAEEGELDALPWVPLLRALAPALHDAGQPELAYDCLMISTTPSSRMSAFDRLTSRSNNKQVILYDVAAMARAAADEP